MRSFVLPKINKRDQEAVHELLAMHYYMTGTPFVRIEEQHLSKALQKLRPGATLLSRKDLACKYLKKCNDKVKGKVDAWLERDVYNCLTSDPWSNIRNEAVINYMLVSAHTSLFLESNYTGDQGHSAAFLAADMSRVIDATPGKMAGAIMDNTTANKAARVLLKRRHPHMFFQGYVSHGLHLFVKDIFAATKATRGRAVADYPPGYPFAYLLEFINNCKDVVKFFNNHHAPKAQLKEALSAAKLKLKMLAQMAPTRWGSIKKMAETMLAAEAILQQLVTARDFVSGNANQKLIRQAVHDTVTKKDFVDLLKMTLSILNPIDIAITYYQSDSVPISDVFATFSNELPRSITALTTITDEERSYMLKLNQHRFEFMYGDAHGIGYVLDPRYVGEGMPLAMRESIENLIYLYPSASVMISESDVGPPDQTSQERMFEEYTDYRIAALEQKAANPPSLMFRMIKEKKISVLKFWQSRGDQWPALQKLSQQVFSMVASSAASERNFSTHGFVHSKLRNCLSEDAVEKLVYIKTNNIQFCNQTGLAAVLNAGDEDDDNTNKSTD
jgi:hypothetical protein